MVVLPLEQAMAHRAARMVSIFFMDAKLRIFRRGYKVFLYLWERNALTMTPREFLDILHVAERLKDTPRHCTTSKRRTESVAEHSWRISLMALLLKGEFPEADMDKVVRMCLIHDLGECFTGDIPTFVKTDADRDVEESLLGRWVRSLPPEGAGEL